MPLVAGGDVDLITLDLAAERDLRLALDDALAELGRHDLHIAVVQAQLLGDLLVGEIQSHEVEAENPDGQRLVVTCQHRASQVVEATIAVSAGVPLPSGLRVIGSLADYVR
jgi:hypothetical protein